MKVSPSMLASDFSRLGEEIERVAAAGADYVHLDVMDGQFVPNITFGAPIIKAVRGFTELEFDVHLMISEPHRYVKDFAQAGADIITIHLEAESDVRGTLKLIKSLGKKAGLAVKPGTEVERIYEYLEDLDLVLIMTVEPGFGGQKFMGGMLEKVKKVKGEARRRGLNILIEVDGGINEATAKAASLSGANVCVAGTSVFNSCDARKAIESLR